MQARTTAITLKKAIAQAMVEQDVNQKKLGEMLGIDSRQVRRILDLGHNSKLDQLESALMALGKKVVINIGQAA